MKRIIRFIARISGVENKIRDEVIYEIGSFMKEDAWWFSSDGNEMAYNTLHIYSDSLIKQKKTPRIDYFRERIVRLGNNRIDGHNTDKIMDCEIE